MKVGQKARWKNTHSYSRHTMVYHRFTAPPGILAIFRQPRLQKPPRFTSTVKKMIDPNYHLALRAEGLRLCHIMFTLVALVTYFSILRLIHCIWPLLLAIRIHMPIPETLSIILEVPQIFQEISDFSPTRLEILRHEMPILPSPLLRSLLARTTWTSVCRVSLTLVISKFAEQKKHYTTSRWIILCTAFRDGLQTALLIFFSVHLLSYGSSLFTITLRTFQHKNELFLEAQSSGKVAMGLWQAL